MQFVFCSEKIARSNHQHIYFNWMEGVKTFHFSCNPWYRWTLSKILKVNRQIPRRIRRKYFWQGKKHSQELEVILAYLFNSDASINYFWFALASPINIILFTYPTQPKQQYARANYPNVPTPSQYGINTEIMDIDLFETIKYWLSNL